MRGSRSLMLGSALIVGALALFDASAAVAGTTITSSTSTNWSGYVAHGTRFRQVTALWTQPRLTCTPGEPTYSAAWVGLGGYNLSSKALEQVGTEADCTLSGKELASAWYELVPSPSRVTKLIVHPGDVMAARVTVAGDRVTLALTDRTRDRGFTKKFTDRNLNVSSADWILEAPSACSAGALQCEPLPLADFGSETFARAQAQTRSGKSGSISSDRWRTAVITLSPTGSQRFAGNEGNGDGESSPSALSAAGTSFTLSYSPITAPAPTPPPVYGAAAVRSVLPRHL